MTSWYCELCGEHYESAETSAYGGIAEAMEHFRVFHPDTYAEIERWPDGAPVVKQTRFRTGEDGTLEVRCVTCKEWKPASEYPRNRAQSRGLHYQCRPCGTAARREHRRRNREAYNAYQREYKRRRRREKATA